MFEEIVGHERIKELLTRQMESGSVPHAYLFTGKRGVGKKTVARNFAKSLTNDSIYDMIEVSNETYGIDAKALSVDTIRKARADAYSKPYASERRVFLIPEADGMLAPAQNALLKILEEPPSYVVFILLAENENLLLPTIRSRCVRVAFAPLSEEELRQLVPEGDELLLALADGSVTMAQELLGDEENAGLLRDFVPLLGGLETADRERLFPIITYLEQAKDRLPLLLDAFTLVLRESLVHEDSPLALKKLSKTALLRGIQLVQDTKKALAGNTSAAVCVPEFMIELWEEIYG